MFLDLIEKVRDLLTVEEKRILALTYSTVTTNSNFNANLCEYALKRLIPILLERSDLFLKLNEYFSGDNLSERSHFLVFICTHTGNASAPVISLPGDFLECVTALKCSSLPDVIDTALHFVDSGEIRFKDAIIGILAIDKTPLANVPSLGSETLLFNFLNLLSQSKFETLVTLLAERTVIVSTPDSQIQDGDGILTSSLNSFINRLRTQENDGSYVDTLLLRAPKKQSTFTLNQSSSTGVVAVHPIKTVVRSINGGALEEFVVVYSPTTSWITPEGDFYPDNSWCGVNYGEDPESIYGMKESAINPVTSSFENFLLIPTTVIQNHSLAIFTVLQSAALPVPQDHLRDLFSWEYFNGPYLYPVTEDEVALQSADPFIAVVYPDAKESTPAKEPVLEKTQPPDLTKQSAPESSLGKNAFLWGTNKPGDFKP